MKPLDKEIVPGFETVRGLNMIDASVLSVSRAQSTEQASAYGD